MASIAYLPGKYREFHVLLAHVLFQVAALWRNRNRVRRHGRRYLAAGSRQKLMISHLLDGNSVLRIRLQQAFYHALAFIRQRNFLGELELVVSNPAVSVVHCVGFKGGFPDDKGVQNDSHCPNVDLVRMTGLV